MKPNARWVTAALVPLVVAALSACSDTLGSGTGGASLSLSAVVGGQAAAAPAIGTAMNTAAFGSGAVAGTETYTGGGHTLTFTSVELVLSEIELKRANHDAVCGGGSDSAAADSARDACEEVEAGPVLLDLPLGTATPDRMFTTQLATGTFDEIEFEIHTPEDGAAADQAFLVAHPDFGGVSIRAAGTFDGTPFTFVTDVNAKQELELATPLTVTGTGPANLTLTIDLGAWFRAADGGLLDPATGLKGAVNEGVITTNIKTSIRGFEDDDHDGHAD